MIVRCLIVCLFLFSINDLSAQRKSKRPIKLQRFTAGVVVGLNLAQIDGDNHQGYKKFGVSVGAQASANITSRFFLTTEILYSQKGSQGDADRELGRIEFSLDMHYLDAVLLFNLNFEEIEKNFHRLNVNAGFSYGRLINFKLEERVQNIFEDVSFADHTDDFRRNETAFIIGGGANINQHFRLEIRHSYSLNYFFNKYLENAEEQVKLRNFWFSLRLIYTI